MFISILQFLCGHFLSSILLYVYSSHFKVDGFSLFYWLNTTVDSLSMFFRLYVACLSPFYNSYVDTFSPASYFMSIHYTSEWLLFLYFTLSEHRWMVFLYPLAHMWQVFLYFTGRNASCYFQIIVAAFSLF